MKRLLIIFAGLVLVLFSSCSNDEPYYAIGVSQELANHRKPSVENLVYTLDITIPENFSEEIKGSEVVEFDLTNISKPLLFDYKVPEEYLRKVIVNDEEVAIDFENEHIIIDENFLKIGANVVTMEFRVGETSLNRNKNYLYTLFVPDRARTAFPCFDQPNLKGKWNLTLHIPEHWEAIANGPMIEDAMSNGIKTLVYKETKPISTYLFDFVAGEFEVVERKVGGRAMKMLHRESDSVKVKRNLDKIFELHRVALAWLEDYSGIEYPFQKFDFALIPSFQYGGMEHPGAITYKASSLFLEESATQNQLLGRASLIAHETAHMWFGDLVTMDWFSDVWMKEVFANFMAAKIVNPSFPEVNHDLRFLLAHYPSAYAVDRTKGTHPIQQPLPNLKDAGTLYGSIIYQKAPIVMRMLERKVGEDLFREGLQTYLNEFAFDNASWDDLIAVLDNISDEDMEKWSKEWIKESGMPYVTPFIRTNDDGTIKQFSIYQRDISGSENLWTQDLSVILEASDSTYFFEVELEGNGTDIDEGKGLQDAAFILCNSDGYGYGHFRMGQQTRQKWLNEIEDFNDPVQRGVGWLSLYESTIRRAISTEDYLKTVIRNLPIEQDPLIQQYMLNSLRTVFWKLITEEDRMINAEGIEEVLWKQIHELEDNKLKKAYFNAYRSLAMSENGVSRLHQLWNKEISIDGLYISENDFTQLACVLALHDFQDSKLILEEQLTRITNDDRKERLQFIMPSLSPEKALRDEFFESLKQLENRHHESWVQSAVGYLHHPLRARESIEYIGATLEMLEEIQQTGDIFFPKRVLDNTFSGHSTVEAVDQVRQFLYRNNHYPLNLKNKILQASDLTFRAAERLEDRADSVKVVLF